MNRIDARSASFWAAANATDFSFKQVIKRLQLQGMVARWFATNRRLRRGCGRDATSKRLCEQCDQLTSLKTRWTSLTWRSPPPK